jgi:hypothetical protein
MTESWQGARHRVFVPQALGADEFLRVTWHERDRIIVFSHWSGNSCVAATPVRITDVPELAELLVAAVGHAVTHQGPVASTTRPRRQTKVARIVGGGQPATQGRLSPGVTPLWRDAAG